MNTLVFKGTDYVTVLKKVSAYAAKEHRPGPLLSDGRPLSIDPGPMVWCILLKVQHHVSGKNFTILRTIDDSLCEKLSSERSLPQIPEADTTLVISLLDAPSQQHNLQKFMERMHELKVIRNLPKTFDSGEYLNYEKHALFSEASHVTATQRSPHKAKAVDDKGTSSD